MGKMIDSFKKAFSPKVKTKLEDPDEYDNNTLLGKWKGKLVGLNLDGKVSGRTQNMLVIGGSGTGKTFKFVKPNMLQENCSVISTDPSGDIFRSFAPYLLSKGYNVYTLNVNDFTMSNNFNPLTNVYDSFGRIIPTQVDILVDLYMKNAKAGNEKGGSDPFWEQAEKAFLTALIYYTLEENEERLTKGFIAHYKDANGKECTEEIQGLEGGKCFGTILRLVHEAKVSEKASEKSTLTKRLDDFFAYFPNNKTQTYYKTFLISPAKTANTILITTAVDLQVFATPEVDKITRTNRVKDMNINIDKIGTEQSYLFLQIPLNNEAYNFLVAMLYSQLYGRLYELGERKLRNKWHIGYRAGTPVFAPFDSEEEARDFYETLSEDNIEPVPYLKSVGNIYCIKYKDKTVKTSIFRKPLEKFVEDIDKMYIWKAEEYCGKDPALPIHVNFFIDEFKAIGEIPKFLDILATCRKYRIGSIVIVQGVDQLKTMYKENEWGIIPNNCDTIVFLGVPNHDVDDKEYIQKALGKTTIMQKSTSDSKSGRSTSYAPTQVDLMSFDEIDALNDNGRDDELVLIRNVPPMLCQKLNLLEHKRWKDVEAVEDFDIEPYFRQEKDDENTLVDLKKKNIG